MKLGKALTRMAGIMMSVCGGEDYTSAKLSSTESWTYGRFEFRAKLPDGAGLWPAILML